MRYRRLGPTLRASEVGLGGAALSGPRGGYGLGVVGEAEARAVLEHAYERGVTLFDCAPVYGFSERRLGAVLSHDPRIRRELTLVSKLGITWGADAERGIDNSPANARRMLEQTLEDMRTDFVDLYMIHWQDPAVPLEVTLEEMVQMREEGLIRGIGLCNVDAPTVERALRTSPIDAVQCDFCALNVTVTATLLPFCRSHDIGFISFGTLAKGILAGTVIEGREYDELDYRRINSWVDRQARATATHVVAMRRLAETRGTTIAQMAVAWVLSHPEVSTALCGSKSVSQLDEVLVAVELELSAEERSALDALACEATPAFTACWP